MQGLLAVPGGNYAMTSEFTATRMTRSDTWKKPRVNTGRKPEQHTSRSTTGCSTSKLQENGKMLITTENEVMIQHIAIRVLR